MDETQDAVGGEMDDGAASEIQMGDFEKQMKELEELRNRGKINARLV